MIEAFRHDAGSVYHIVKRCLSECPAFVNGSAEHTRCCSKQACNDVISIGKAYIPRERFPRSILLVTSSRGFSRGCHEDATRKAGPVEFQLNDATHATISSVDWLDI